MKKSLPGLVAGTACLALGLVALPAAAVPSDGAPASSDKVRAKPDNRTSPQIKKQARLKAKARAMVENGTAKARTSADGSEVVEVADGEFVELAVTGTDKIWTVLSQFGTQGSKKLGMTPGPVHNAIPAPDRTKDNSTTHEEDYSQAYYDELFNGSGESMKNFYEAQSNGDYSVDVTTEDWVTVPGNASTYGDNAVEDDGGSWAFINDTVDAWAGSRSTADLDAYLSQFDKWDRYDFDEDGDFNEPDGYIDHFQAVHAGEGEEAGADPDAIWSHRWYVNPTTAGSDGPVVAGRPNLNGGARIGSSSYFIGDYTVEPENGGLGVFAHEYGHDLGLPDFYDTNGGDNGTSFWTTMSSGSWLGHGGADEGIGTQPGIFGPEEKLFLGWLKYLEVDKTASTPTTQSVNLTPSQLKNDSGYQAIKVNLKSQTTTAASVPIKSGSYAWWSGRGDDLRNTLTRDVPAASSVTVTADAWYQIEKGYDFLYGQYSLDGGDTWTTIGQPVTGNQARWGGVRFAYKPGGKASKFRFRYATDGGVNETGAFLDNISVKSDQTTFTDGAETLDPGWTAKGWKRSTGTETVTANRYYLIENRQYVGYDATLAEGPYNFSEAVTRPNWVEFFDFQDGMLVWLVDPTTADNNTSSHPGTGYALPVDATPNSFDYPDGSSPTNRREPFDATFGLDLVPRTCLHKQVAADNELGYTTLETCSGDVQQQDTFDDTTSYYDGAHNPQNSVKVAGEGVKATVKSVDGSSRNMLVDITY